ncbi:MAG: diguanylate cyclase [Cyanobacteria bacterium J06632_3]
MLVSLSQYLPSKKGAHFPLGPVVTLPYLCLVLGGVVVIGVLSSGLVIGAFDINQKPLDAEHLWIGLAISLLPNLLFALLIGHWLKRKLLALQTGINATDEATNETTIQATESSVLNGIPDLLVHIREDGQSLHVVSHGMANRDEPSQIGIPQEKSPNVDKPIGEQQSGIQQSAITKRDCASVNLLSIFQAGMTPELAAERMQLVRQAIATGKQQVCEYELFVGEDSFYEEVRALKIGSHEALMMIRDITKRKRTEKQQKYALSLLTATLESTAEGILSVTCLGDVLAYNQKFLQMWDIPAALLAPGSCPKERFQGIAEKTMDPAGFIRRAVEISRSAPDEVSLDLIEMKDGRIFERHSQAQIVDGKAIGRIWTYRDVTEKKRAAVEIAAANRQLQRLANLDGLTQVANRRYFDSYLAEQWKTALRDQQPLSLILFDVDFFKRYNDHYGHLAGDRCLCAIAQTTQLTVQRPTDLVARYGGEEFAVILPETPLSGAIAIAQQIQAAIQTLKIDHADSEVSPLVTISLGIACLIPQTDTGVEALIKVADTALYEAKRQGRNRYALQSKVYAQAAGSE